MILTYSVLALIFSMFVMTGFSGDVFAEEIIIKIPPFSLGSNHDGSMIKTQTVSSDGYVWTFLTYTEPVEREHMTINVQFTDKDGKMLYDINYDILATQNDQVILDETMINQKIGIKDHLTQALPSNDGVVIKITLQGTGTNPPLTEPHGGTIQTNIVPEFGGIATVILGVSILSIVIISTKNKVSFSSLTH